MLAIIGVFISVFIVLHLIYPLIIWIERVFMADVMFDRKKEWKVLTGKLMLTELQIISTINSIRAALHQEPISKAPFANSVKGSAWSALKHIAESSVVTKIQSIESKRKQV